MNPDEAIAPGPSSQEPPSQMPTLAALEAQIRTLGASNFDYERMESLCRMRESQLFGQNIGPILKKWPIEDLPLFHKHLVPMHAECFLSRLVDGPGNQNYPSLSAAEAASEAAFSKNTEERDAQFGKMLQFWNPDPLFKARVTNFRDRCVLLASLRASLTRTQPWKKWGMVRNWDRALVYLYSSSIHHWTAGIIRLLTLLQTDGAEEKADYDIRFDATGADWLEIDGRISLQISLVERINSLQETDPGNHPPETQPVSEDKPAMAIPTVDKSPSEAQNPAPVEKQEQQPVSQKTTKPLGKSEGPEPAPCCRRDVMSFVAIFEKLIVRRLYVCPSPSSPSPDTGDQSGSSTTPRGSEMDGGLSSSTKDGKGKEKEKEIVDELDHLSEEETFQLHRLVFAILPNEEYRLNAGYLTSLEFVEPGYLANVTLILLRAGKTHLAAFILWISIQIENVLAHGIGIDNILADIVAMLSELKLGPPYYSSTPPKDVVQQQAAKSASEFRRLSWE